MHRIFLSLKAIVNLNTLFIAATMLAVASPAVANIAGVMVAPTRVILEGGSRSEQMIIVNNSKKPQVFRVSFRNMAFPPEGPVDVTEPKDGQMFADSMIRVSTREIRLKPNETQVLRVLLRKPEGLAPGEYRSHMTLTGLPDEENPLVADKLNDQLAIRLLPIYSYTFPVIVRQGALASKLKEAKISLLKAMPDGSVEMKLDVASEGNKSIFYDAYLIDPKDKKSAPFMQVKNMSIYWPGLNRQTNFILTKRQYERYKAGGMTLKLQEVSNIGGPLGQPIEKTM